MFAFPTPAALGDGNPPPPPDTPSIGQYVETVPTAGGGSATGVGIRPRRNLKLLPHRVAQQLAAQPASVAKRLITVATSPVYGAPQKALKTPPGVELRGAAPEDSNALKGALSAAVNAAGDSGDDHIFWLLAVLIVTTSAMVWTVRQRR
jgi:hypothetical protein